MMEVDIDDRAVRSNLRKLAQLTGRGIGEVVEQQARGYLRRVISMTPPQGGGSRGNAAKKALAGRIRSDLRGIFAPVTLSGVRAEQHPDLLSILRRQGWRRRKGSWRRRGANPKYYVDRRKLQRLEQGAIRRIGRLMGGWNSGAAALSVKRPAWAARHGTSEGSSSVRLGPAPRIELENAVSYQAAAHLERISDRALVAQQRALARQLPYVLRKYLRQSRLGG